MANDEQLPVVLELAPLPREQLGPFLLLGVDKAASPEQIEANWAQRLIWARKNQLGVPLEDINWAREVLSDPDRRARADASSLNPDTADGLLAALTQQLPWAGESSLPGWQPLDVENELNHYAPAAEVPDWREVRTEVALPDLPRDFPIVPHLLQQLAREAIDPWALDLPTGPNPDEAV
jgi:hypothetical protein